MIHSFFKFYLVFLLALPSLVSATQKSVSRWAQELELCCSRPLLEIKTGYFFFSNSTLRKIYDHGGWDVQLCGSYPIWSLTDRWTLNAYGAVEYFYKSGTSLHDHQKTSLWSVPVNIGLKPAYKMYDNLDYYFAVGPRYFYLHQHNRSSYVYKNKSKNGLGFFINTGFNYFLCERFVVDIFGEYSYAKTHFRGNNTGIYTKRVQLGGFTFGGGLGYDF